ncbi:MAG: family 43 glycosylhydrolase [Clostridia bacterium]
MGFRMEDSRRHLVGDIIPYYDEETKKYHLYYLRGNPDGCGLARFDTPWAHCATKDWKDIEVYPDALTKGMRGDWDDGACFTGCVIKYNGIYYLYYTAFSPYGDHSREVISLATSVDGVTFQKHDSNPLLTPDYQRYGASDDFRDPYVWYDEQLGKWRMLFAAGLMDEPCSTRRGAVGQAYSEDLLHWELQEALYAPRIYPSLECPDLFKLGDWYYLLFSQFGRTEYRMSKTSNGPWLMPKHPCFDCGEYFFYAAKTLYDGEKRLLLGWCGSLKDNLDAHMALWGGIAVTPRELHADADGELYLTCPEALTVQGTSQTHDFVHVFDNVRSIGACLSIGQPDRFDAVLMVNTECREYLLKVDVKTQRDRGVAGVILRSDDTLERCYMLEINFANRMMYFKRYDSFTLFSGDTVNMDIVLAEKSLRKWGDSLHLELHFQQDILEVFGASCVMTVPVAQMKQGKVGFFAGYVEANFSNICFQALDNEQ